MSKRLIVILTLAFVVGLTVATYAEVQNVKVSGDLTLKPTARTNLILRKTQMGYANLVPFNQYDRNISGILSHVRVRVDADLTDNVSTTVRLINERIWDEEEGTTGSTADNTDIDLDLAYVHLKEFLYSPLSLTVGRQELHFGNDLIIGDVDTNGLMAGHGVSSVGTGIILPKSLDDLSIRKAFDAVRATLNYDPLVVDVAYAKIDSNVIDKKDDVELYGLNANYALDKNTTLEAYYWEKIRQKAGAAVDMPNPTRAHPDVVRTLGGRVQNTSIKNLMVGLEGAFQFGNKVNNTTIYPDDSTVNSTGGNRSRKAYAIQLTSQYNLSELSKTLEPVLGMSYTLLSGDPYRSTKPTYRGWDPMFENQAGGTLFNKILGYSNAQLVNAKVSMKALEDVKLAVDYYYLRLMKPYRAIDGVQPFTVNLTGVLGDPTYKMKEGEKVLGNEVDATLTYDYTEDVQFGLSMGWFFPGDAFTSVNDETASQVIGSMKVTF